MSIKRQADSMVSLLKKSVQGGLLHIFTGSALSNVIKAVPGLLMPIVLIPEAINQLGQIDNLMSYLLLIDGLGMSGVILRYCSIAESDGECKSYFRFSLRFGLIVYGILTAVIIPLLFVCPIYDSWENNTLLGALLCTAAFQFIYNCVQNFLRANRANKSYSRFSVLYAATMAFFPLLLAALFRLDFVFGGKHQFSGMIVGRYISYAICLAAAVMFLRRMPVMKARPERLMPDEKKNMFAYAFWAMLASLFSQIIPVNEQLFVNSLIRDRAAMAPAVYKFASILPSALQVGVTSVVVFIFPYFAKHFRDGKWVWSNYKKLTILLSAGMAFLTALMVVFTPQIIYVYKREFLQYPASVSIMRILCITFGINACLRMPAGNILAAIGEIRYNMLISAGSAVLHLGIGTLMVLRFGIYGAAYGMCIVYILSGAASFFYLRHYCRKLAQKNPPD